MLVDGSFTLRIESEDDILLIAEMIQRRKGKKSENAEYRNLQNVRRERMPAEDTKDRIRHLLQAKFPAGEFRREQVFALVNDKSRSTVDASLRALVREGRLFKVRNAVFAFEKTAPALSTDSLLDLQATPGFIDVMRIIKTLADQAHISFYGNSIVSRQADAQGHIALDVRIDKSHFHAFNVKVPMELVVDAASLIERLQREPAARICMQKKGTLQIGQYNLVLEKCQNLEGAEPPTPALEWKSELTIRRQELEKILADNRVNSDYVDIIAEQGHVLFQSFNEKGEYPGEPLSAGYACKEPTRSRLHYLDVLIKALRAARCDTILLKNNGSYLAAEFQIDPAIQCRLFLACKPLQVEEVAGLP